MVEVKFEKPPVQYGSSGVSRVDAADILRSAVGRREIEKAAAVATLLRLRILEPAQSNGTGR